MGESRANPRQVSNHPEQQYLDLMRRIWSEGSERVDRTGVGTRSVFGTQLRFDLADNAMPLITTKRVYWKTATREMLWFLTGDTNIRHLVLQGVKIWNEWPHAKYVQETGDAIALDLNVVKIKAATTRILIDCVRVNLDKKGRGDRNRHHCP